MTPCVSVDFFLFRIGNQRTGLAASLLGGLIDLPPSDPLHCVLPANSGGMETPLDVLSRAATMVETDRPTASNAVLRSEDLRSEASKELPSRVNRQRRSTERRELAQVLRFDELRNVGSRTAAASMTDTTAAAVSTRCAGTQTEITTMRLEDNDVGVPEVNPALPTPSTSHLAPSPPHRPTLSGSGKETHQVRPSVITCASSQPREGAVKDAHCSANSQTLGRTNGYTTSSTSTHPTNCHRREISLGVCDPVIEEHFRRSLGKDYKENYGAAKPAGSADGVVTMITGSVDDHFAKALGDKWPQIKNVMEPAGQSPPSSPRGLLHPASLMST